MLGLRHGLRGSVVCVLVVAGIWMTAMPSVASQSSQPHLPTVGTRQQSRAMRPVLMAQNTDQGGGGAVFRITTPADGSSVRGIVDVTVPKGSVPEGGFVAFALDDPANFCYATVADATDGLFKWKWDTRMTDPSDPTGQTRLYPDGRHTIYAIAHDALGREVDGGEAQVVVTVTNNAPPPAGTIHLAYSFNVGDDDWYQAKYMLTPKPPGYSGWVPKVQGIYIWDNHVDAIDDQSQMKLITSTYHQVSVEDTQVMYQNKLTEAWNATMFGNLFDRDNTCYMVNEQGDIDMRGRRGPFLWARSGLVTNLFIPLPSQDVNINDSWDGTMKIWSVGSSSRTLTVHAHSTLEGLEYIGNVKAARIRTTYGCGLPPGDLVAELIAQANGANNGGGGMGQKFTRQKTKIKIEGGSLSGERTTWLDYNTGKILQVHDVRTLSNLPKVFPQDNKLGGGSSGGGMGGGGGMSMGGGMAAGGAGIPDIDMSWLPGFDLTQDYITLQGVLASLSASASASQSSQGGVGGLLGQLLGGGGGGGSASPEEIPPPPYKETFDIVTMNPAIWYAQK